MVGPSARNRSRWRNLSAVELCAAISLFATLLGVAIPTFAREMHRSRFVEATDGLNRIGGAAVAYAADRAVAQAFPPSVALTPATPPRGRCEVDPAGTWDGPTWTALAFAPAPPGTPHCFAFGFESALSPARSTFRAQAHGDLDGDGVESTFEITGHSVAGDAHGATVDRGMYVDSEVE
jgi:type IV pilus assembly protein PilA